MTKKMEFMSWKFSQIMWMWEPMCLFLRYLLVMFSDCFQLHVFVSACQVSTVTIQPHFVDCTE